MIYNVKSTLNHDGEEFKAGSTIALDDEVAAPLLSAGVLEVAEKAEYPKVVDGIRYEFDGTEPDGSILAVDDATFDNLQESAAGFGKTEAEALAKLREEQATLKQPAASEAPAPETPLAPAQPTVPDPSVPAQPPFPQTPAPQMTPASANPGPVPGQPMPADIAATLAATEASSTQQSAAQNNSVENGNEQA